jgi:nitroreductase
MPVRESALAAWSAAIDEFPICGTPNEKLRALAGHAIRAPSSHNSQPWTLRIADNHLSVRADRQRRLPVVDPADRELVISCGAFVGYLEVALRQFGYEGAIELVPESADPDLLARVGLGSLHETTLLDRALFAAMGSRRTHRLPFLTRSPEPPLFAELEAYGSRLGAWFRILQSDAHRRLIADLITEGDRRQMADPAFREELVRWLHPNRTKSQDGMPGWTFGLNDLASLAVPLVVRTFDTGAGRAAIDRDLALGSPILAILGTPTDTAYDWMIAGRVLSHVLLRAAAEGVAASFLNQPIEIAELRGRVSALLGTSGYPQMILRMGYPVGEDRRTPRRDLSDVLEMIE